MPLQINPCQPCFAGVKAFAALLIRGYEEGKFIITHTHALLCVWHPKPKARHSLGLHVAPGDLVSPFPLTLFFFFYFLFPQDSKARGCAPALWWKTELTTVPLSSREAIYKKTGTLWGLLRNSNLFYHSFTVCGDNKQLHQASSDITACVSL